MEQGRHRRQETHQGNETLTIAADEKPVPIRLIVRKAIYGDVAGGTTKDVTTNVADMVKDNTLSITPGNALFGDPTKGQAKQLSVDYTFDGAAKSKTGQDRRRWATLHYFCDWAIAAPGSGAPGVPFDLRFYRERSYDDGGGPQ